MKLMALVAAISLVPAGALLSGCNRDADRSGSGGGSSASGTSSQTPGGGAPKRPASPSGSGSTGGK